MAWGDVRAKRSSPFGLFRLRFPLLAKMALAWVYVSLIPNLFGVALSTLGQSARLGVAAEGDRRTGRIMGVVRLGLTYSGGRASA